MVRRIWVTHRFPAFHQWVDAPDSHAFLRNLHRHQFHVRAELTVEHDDRELEFFEVQKMLATLCRTYFEGKTVGSCEMMAGEIATMLDTSYPERDVAVEVSEDGENGAVVHL